MRRLVAKLLRYATVSVISTATCLSVLGILVGTRALSAGWANLVATGIGTVPSFELNRRWVWGRSGRRSMGRELAPFWALSFTGLGLSTLAVSVATGWADSAGLGGAARTLVAELANVGTFGCLWIVQYVLLDRVLFRSGPSSRFDLDVDSDPELRIGPGPGLDIFDPGRREEARQAA